jgi:hypothetical protein
VVYRQLRRTLERDGLIKNTTILWTGVPEEFVGEYIHFTYHKQVVTMDQFELYIGRIGWVRVNRPEWSQPLVEKQANLPNLTSWKGRIKFW